MSDRVSRRFPNHEAMQDITNGPLSPIPDLVLKNVDFAKAIPKRRRMLEKRSVAAVNAVNRTNQNSRPLRVIIAIVEDPFDGGFQDVVWSFGRCGPDALDVSLQFFGTDFLPYNSHYQKPSRYGCYYLGTNGGSRVTRRVQRVKVVVGCRRASFFK